MNDPLLVRGFEGVRDLCRHRQRVIDGDRALRDPIGQRRPFDEFQDERRDAVAFLEPVDAADVGMIERRQRLRFTLKARDALRIGNK